MTTPTNPTPAIRKPSSGLFTTSNFESMSHEQLRAMIEHADPAGTQNLGVKLQVAAATIKKIGEDLKGHMAKVEWAGQGGDSFREWGTDMANAALRLGEFSHNTGSWMIDAAATLSGVKSAMPEVSTESKTVLDTFRANYPGQVGATVPAPDQGGALSATASGPSQAQAYAAQQRLDADRAEAARLMRKLAESYSWSAHQITAGERPTFRPMPNFPGSVDEFEYVGPAGGGGGDSGRQSPGVYGGGSPSVGPVAGGHASRAGSYGASLSHMSEQTAVAASLPERHGMVRPIENPRTAIDSVATAPTAPSTLPIELAGGHTGGTPGGPSPLPGVVGPPVVGTGPGAVGATDGGRLPLPSRSSLPTGSGTGVVRPGLGVPRASDPGVIGGRPVPTGPEHPGGQIPRDLTGKEGQGQAQGRSPMGVGPAFGGPAGPTGGRAGMASGRRLATEPGGVIGGMPARRPGATGEFTPGGAGLVRSRPALEGNSSVQGGVRGQGFPVPGMSGGTPSRRGQGGQRPDYLVEDEATWTQGNRRTVPPVVE